MPPVKVPRKALKSMEPAGTTKSVIPKKKKIAKNYDSFGIYLFRILKSVNSEVGISRKSIMIMNSFVNDMIEKIACEGGRLLAHGKKTTLTEREIRTASKLIVPGELGKHALVEGDKALHLFKSKSNSQSY